MSTFWISSNFWKCGVQSSCDLRVMQVTPAKANGKRWNLTSFINIYLQVVMWFCVASCKSKLSFNQIVKWVWNVRFHKPKGILLKWWEIGNSWKWRPGLQLSLKCLLHKHNDLTRIFSTKAKNLGMMGCDCNPNNKEGETGRCHGIPCRPL